ncbi:MAG TPA: hypothetical protein VGG75_35400 [Trebonia sp.]
MRAHGEVGCTARLFPLTVDGLIYVSSMVMLDSALVRWLLGLGIAANVAHDLRHGWSGAVVGAWPHGHA